MCDFVCLTVSGFVCDRGWVWVCVWVCVCVTVFVFVWVRVFVSVSVSVCVALGGWLSMCMFLSLFLCLWYIIRPGTTFVPNKYFYGLILLDHSCKHVGNLFCTSSYKSRSWRSTRIFSFSSFVPLVFLWQLRWNCWCWLSVFWLWFRPTIRLGRITSWNITSNIVSMMSLKGNTGIWFIHFRLRIRFSDLPFWQKD